MRDLKGSLAIELTMRLAHPFTSLSPTIPDMLCGGEHASKPFRPLAFIDRKTFAPALPRRRRDHLEFVCARVATIGIKTS
jgi:hypothetical protein